MCLSNVFLIGAYLLILMTSVFALGEKSKEMCKEYAKAVYAEEETAVLLPGSNKLNVSQCGIVEVPLIVGGVKTGLKEFPHMAVIGFGKESNISWLCGGSLISDRFVLTAGHCLKSKEKGPALWVKMGDRSIDDSDGDARPQQNIVIERIPHPSYVADKRYNDIGLIKLKEPVKFDGFVRPACLFSEDIIPWTTGIATGFGKTAYLTDTSSNELLKVQLKIIPNNKCNVTFESDIGSWKLKDGIVDTMLCAGEKKGGKDTCQGDSGGPLQQVLDKPYCMYSVFGVTSFGKFCGFRNSPAVYTRVSKYVEWIESIVWP